MSAEPAKPESGAERKLCPSCGSPIGRNRPAGLCPRCAIQEVLDGAAPVADSIEEDFVRQFGNYRLLEEIGAGGFGVVYAAEQIEPIRRRVAIKIVKAGMDTRQVVARFEAERQALALMDHPNIARVFDAGATPTGRPFFVMELVRGSSITRYCDEHRLGTRERIALLQKVCHAVQHAHHKGIIHRDLKPSNILVAAPDGQPEPKVIDFGIAKATQIELTDKTLYTQFQQFIGTPAYMSPEQAGLAGLDVDTRTDVHSLGALLYELLTGSAPFDAKTLSSVPPDEARRIIREVDPPKPSSRTRRLGRKELSALADRRRSDDRKLPRDLQGDLDRVVMKALEKDRTRRYATAAALAEDLQHYLDDEPVSAQPPGIWYVTRKAVVRHRLAFGAGAAVLITLLLGTIVSLSLAIRARQAEERAQKNERTATNLVAELGQTNWRLEREKYRSDIQLAEARIGAGEPGRAMTALWGTPVNLRGWEWRYLWSQARPDDHEVLATLPRHDTGLAFSGDGRLLVWNASVETVAWDMVSRSPAYRMNTRGLFALGHRTPLLACIEINSAERAHRVIDLTSSKRFAVAEAVRDSVIRQEFTSDDQILVTVAVVAAGSCELVATDVQSGEPIWRRTVPYPTGGNWARRMDISPEGDAVAISLEGGNVHVFDMKNGRERLKVKTTDDEMSMAVRYSPNGRHLLTTSGYSEGLIRIWDAQDGRSLGNLAGHRTYVTDLVFTPDGRELFSASGDYTIRIWDWAERRSVGVLHGHSDEVWCLALSPDGRALASRGKDGAIHLWDLSRSRKRHEFRLLPNTAGDASAKLWDNDKTFTFAEHSQIILANSFPESEQAHSRLVAWDVATLRRTPLPFENPSILSPDGRQIASFAPIAGDPPRQTVTVSNIRGQILTNFTLPGTLSSLISWVSYSADGQLLVEARAPPSSRAETATALCSVSSTDSWQHRQFAHKIRPGDQFSRLCGLASSNWFALVGDAVVVVFDVTRPDLPSKRITFTSRPRVVFSDVAVSSDGKSIATSSEDGYLTVWDWETLAVKWQTRAFLQGAHSVAFSSDGLRLAAGSNASEAVKLWDTATGQELVTLRGEGSRFIGLKFSPDGQHLLGVNAKGAAHLWSAPSWEEITTAAAKERPHSQPQTPK